MDRKGNPSDYLLKKIGHQRDIGNISRFYNVDGRNQKDSPFPPNPESQGMFFIPDKIGRLTCLFRATSFRRMLGRIPLGDNLFFEYSWQRAGKSVESGTPTTKSGVPTTAQTIKNNRWEISRKPDAPR
jgi:hypothetical protein